MKKTIIKKRTRSLLCVLIICGLIGQMLVSAKPEAKVNGVETQLPTQQTPAEVMPEIVEEAEEFRTEYSKSYLRSDGTYVQVTAMKPIHYKNGDKYDEIDNRLQKVIRGEKTFYENRKGNYQVSFPEELQDPVEIEYKDYTLSMQMINDEVEQEENEPDVEESIEDVTAITEENAGVAEGNEEEAPDIAEQTVEELSVVSIEELSQEVETLEESAEETTNEIVSETANETAVETDVSVEEESEVAFTSAGETRVFTKASLQNREDKIAAVLEENVSTLEKDKPNNDILPEYKTGEITYTDEEEDVSISYQSSSDRIKESIIINNKDAVQESYVYQIDAGKLNADKTEDGRILFYKKSKKKPVFALEAPYMFDASGEENISYDIETSLVENEDGYQVVYSPSSEWMLSEKRQFPVTIDPTVTLLKSDNQFTDGYVFSRFATSNLSGSASVPLYANYMSAYYFKSNSLPNSDTAIISSKLYLNAESIEGNPIIQVKRVTSAWDPATLTYSNRPTTESDILDYATVDSPTVLDITPYAQDFSKKVENYGLEIGIFTNNGSFTIPTINATSNCPSIVTEYSILAGDYADMSCHTASAGKAGTITVNDFTGYMQYEAEDLAIPGNRMPVSIKRVNTAGGADASAGFGGAFFTNYHQKLMWDSATARWKFRTEKGGYLYFKNDEDGKITDEQNAGYELNVSGTIFNDYTAMSITNPEGHKLFFNSDGNLIRIEDEAQAETSKIEITYLATDKINQITDGAGGRYKFVYNNNNRITEIQYLGKTGTTVIKKVSYEYYSPVSVYVQVKVKYDDENYSVCAVEDSRIEILSNDDGSGIDISYYNFNENNSANPYYYTKVKKITEYGRNRTKGDELTFTYDTMQTTIADLNGNKEIYQFDRYGKVTSVRNQEGEAVFPQYGGEQGQLLGFSDIRSTVIGNNLAYIRNYDSLPLERKNHDNSIPVLSGKVYDELTTAYDQDYTMEYAVTDTTLFKKGDTLLFGAWLKGSFQGEGNGPESDRGVTIELRLGSGGSDGETETIEIKPNLYVSDWQYILGEVTLEFDAPIIVMYLKINGQKNNVYISNFEFKRIAGEGAEGTPVPGATATPIPTATPVPTATPTPIPTPVTDSYGNILSETDERGAVTTYTYDAAGNELTRKISADGKYLYSYNYYDTDKNMLMQETDASEIGYSYTYNNDKSLQIITDNGSTFETKGTVYQYNSMGEVTKIHQSNIKTGYFDTALSEEVTYTYEDDSQTITTDNNTYTILYNPFGDVSEIKHGENSLVSYEYESNSNRIPKKVTYGNEDTIEYTYDSKNRLTNDGQGTYTYNEQGELASVEDNVNNTTTLYEDDKTSVYSTDDSQLLYKYKTTDDGFRFERHPQTDGEIVQWIAEHYQDADYANGVSQKNILFNGSNIVTHKETTDRLGRLYQTNLIKPNNSSVLKKTFQYKDLSGNRTTEQVSGIDYTYGNGAVYNEDYTYNNYGQIETITDSEGNVRRYKYDGFGQLIREDDPVKNKTILYTYSEGNITKKQEYAYTTADAVGTCTNEINYTYGNNNWKDLLTSYNGQTITYDAIGNPTNYKGNTLTWEKGRQLKTYDRGSLIIDYKYDVNGLRTEKKVGNTVHKYTYVNGQLYAYEVNGQQMFFSYDDNGSPLSFTCNGAVYHYQTNLQGDVIGIINNSGTKVVSYSYDAWGCPTGSVPSSGVGYYNPLRYRGYVFDYETGWYYLQSRYYDPNMGRFLNADDPTMLGVSGTVLGYNLFAYCDNNPVNMIDEDGEASKYINDQSDSSIRNIKWGLYGKTGPNGCGWVAVYNVMVSYSNKITYRYVIDGLGLAGGVLGFGKLGTAPGAITRYLKSKFWFVRTAGPITNLWGIKAELSGCVIVLYQHRGWNGNLHYVAGIKVGGGVDGKFDFYNDPYTKGKRRISIWKYIDILKKNGCKILMFWGVAGKKGWW
ncbi:MAG: hypothetical protein E7267_02790 [Lachnospiraceae bacterium]|nr:hypothetical protein [Lachnospiraceae bacterium]